MDEQALRRLMQDLVEDIEPAPESLERLRRAVPARRQRRRQVLVAVTVAIASTGVVLPLMMGAGVVPGLYGEPSASTTNSDRPASPESRPAPTGGQSDAPSSHGPTDHAALIDGSIRPGDDTSTGAGASEGTADANETLAGISPSCTSDQLGSDDAWAGSADDAGRIYGRFRVVNISGETCTVNDPGIVDASPQGDSPAEAIEVLDHTAGDEATRLPSPEMEHDELVLKPHEAFEILFAWIPRSGGGPTGCENDSAPSATSVEPEDGDDETPDAPAPSAAGTSDGEDSDGPSGDGGGSGEGSADQGGSSDSSGSEDNGGSADSDNTGADGGTDGSTSGGSDTPSGGYTANSVGSSSAPSVVVQYILGTGELRVGPLTLRDACMGTIYRTGLLEALS